MPKRCRNSLITRTSPLVLVLLIFVLGDTGCGQTTPGSLPPTIGCTRDSDCPAGPCHQSICTQTSLQDAATNDAGSPESLPDLSVPDALPPPPPGPCTPGATWDCYTGPAHTTNVGKCQAGKQVCLPSKVWDSCKGETLPQTEYCDGEDNNCNGKTDENFPNLGAPCSLGEGECAASGVMACTKDKLNVACDAQPGEAKDEVCDGKDNNCDGQIDEGFKGLGDVCTKGKGTCLTSGKLICSLDHTKTTCDAKEILPGTKDMCNGQDNDCNGKTDENCTCKIGNTRACSNNTGICTAGTQTCGTSAKWEPCTGQGPSSEICDGLDNNCDGQVDEDWPDKGKTCTMGLGMCQVTGHLICSSSKMGTVCNKAASPASAEICDGKDNDCDGQTDENLNGSPCKTSKPGSCEAGTLSCVSGTPNCVQKNQPRQEICGNTRDDDCNGKTDEICGLPYPFALVKSDGSSAKHRGFTSKWVSKGTYELTHPTLKCPTHPLFLTANSRWMHSLSYICKGDTFVVHTSARVKSLLSTSFVPLEDLSFHAVSPGLNDTWTLINGGQCNLANNECVQLQTNGQKVRVVRRAIGYYRIYTSLCGISWNPLFVTLRATAPSGYVSGWKSNAGDYCDVTTFNAKGMAVDRSFSFWLPSASDATWLSAEHTINTSINHKSNSPGSTSVLWTSQHKNSTQVGDCPQSRNCTRLTLSYKGWAFPSVPVAIYRRPAFGTVSAFLSSGTYIITIFTSPTGAVGVGRATVLFAH